MKWTSRTFWIAIAWVVLVIVGVIFRPFESWIQTLIVTGGGVATAYIGAEKWLDAKRNVNKK